MDMAIQVQIVDKEVYILCSSNTIGKGMNLTILTLAIGK